MNKKDWKINPEDRENLQDAYNNPRVPYVGSLKAKFSSQDFHGSHSAGDWAIRAQLIAKYGWRVGL